MSDPENRTARDDLEDLLYNRIDAGLYKRDAGSIADAIQNLIDERIADFMYRRQMAEKGSTPPKPS